MAKDFLFRTNFKPQIMHLMWAFRLCRRAFRYIFARSISTPLPKFRPVPNSRSRPRMARKGCRSNP